MKNLSRKFGLFTIAVTICFVSTLPLRATTFAKETFTCPIGGKKFKANTVMSNSTFGERPDGKPYSPMPIYPIIECPDNGFLLFDEKFSDQELKKLNEVVFTAEYQNMRTTETPHFRAYWLKKEVGRPSLQKISSIRQAVWETDQNWDRESSLHGRFCQ